MTASYDVRGGDLTLSVSPAHGGKMTSLIGPAGIEWLAPSGAAEWNPSGRFTDSDMSGWDECAPSIDACVVAGAVIPDHGDLWSTPWEVAEGQGLTMLARGRCLEYLLRRSITPTRNGLRLEYTATALADPIPFLWAAHPQFLSPPGTFVRLPTEVRRVVDVLSPDLRTVDWTETLGTIDTMAAGTYRKLYVDPSTSVDRVSIVRADGAELRLSWSRSCPYLGLWFDNSAFARQPVIAIEPTTGYFDSVQRAEGLGLVPRLEPGVSLTWWLEISATAPGVT